MSTIDELFAVHPVPFFVNIHEDAVADAVDGSEELAGPNVERADNGTMKGVKIGDTVVVWVYFRSPDGDTNLLWNSGARIGNEWMMGESPSITRDEDVAEQVGRIRDYLLTTLEA